MSGPPAPTVGTVHRHTTGTASGPDPVVATNETTTTANPLAAMVGRSSETASTESPVATAAPQLTLHRSVSGPVARQESAPVAGDAGSGESTSGDGSDTSDDQLDLLVRQLYPRLERRLQAGLLVERERAGALTDLP